MKENQKVDLKTWVERLICQNFSIENPEELAKKNRKPEILIPRQVATVILVLSGKTLSNATGFYGQNYCTAINSRKRIFEILETKDFKHGYHRIVKIFKQTNRIYPEVSLSSLPRGWDDPNQQICKS